MHNEGEMEAVPLDMARSQVHDEQEGHPTILGTRVVYERNSQGELVPKNVRGLGVQSLTHPNTRHV